MQENPKYNRISPETLSQKTLWIKEQLWFTNLADNLASIRSGHNALELRGTCNGPCIIVGAGPSVDKFNMLDKLKGTSCHIIATDRQLIPLLERGIVPEYVLSVDGDPVVAKYYDHPLVQQHSSKIRGIFNVQVHPETVKAFSGEKYWFVVIMDKFDKNEPSVTRAIYWMTGQKTAAVSYGNVGSFAWSFADFAGHKNIILVGIDFSYGPDVQPMQTLYWNGILKDCNGNTQDALKRYRWEKNPFGYKVLTDVLFDGYRQVLQHGIEVTSTKTIQCSPYTVLHGSRITIMNLEDALRKFTLQL